MSCSVAATMANGGKYYRPRIVKEAVAEDGKVVIEGDALVMPTSRTARPR